MPLNPSIIHVLLKMTNQVPPHPGPGLKPQFRVMQFDDLSIHELKAIYQLRQQVFIIEQDCPYPDIDDADLNAQHVFHGDDQHIHAYARILRDKQGNCHIGRVVVAKDKRQHGLGDALMKAAINQCRVTDNDCTIIISAQSYLVHFYGQLGFQETGDYYLEDNISHMRMILAPA